MNILGKTILPGNLLRFAAAAALAAGLLATGYPIAKAGAQGIKSTQTFTSKKQNSFVRIGSRLWSPGTSGETCADAAWPNIPPQCTLSGRKVRVVRF